MIADTLGHDLDLGFPVRRDGLEKRVEVRWPDNVHPTGEGFGSERQPDQRGIPAVGAAHDGDPLGIGDLLFHGPVHAVDQVVVHLPRPFHVRRIEVLLADARGAAIVRLQHRVPTVGQPLRVRVVAPRVPRPRAAVNEQNHGQGLGGLAIHVRVEWKREIAHKVQPVAGLDDDGTHLGQRLIGEGLARNKQRRELGLAGRVFQVAAIQQAGLGRGVRVDEGHGPEAIGL